MTNRSMVFVLLATAALAYSGDAFARSWTEVRNGTTYNCESVQKSKCKVDAEGHEYDCTYSQGEKCVAVAGPGSGKKPAAFDPGYDPAPKSKSNFSRFDALGF